MGIAGEPWFAMSPDVIRFLGVDGRIKSGHDDAFQGGAAPELPPP